MILSIHEYHPTINLTEEDEDDKILLCFLQTIVRDMRKISTAIEAGIEGKVPEEE